MNKIKVLLIEDNRLLREGILQILKQHSDIEVLESSNETKTTFSMVHEMNPDVILMDLGLRNQNSLRVVEILHEEFPKAKIVVMDLAPVQADILLYIKAGANGFILKDASLDDFIVTIRTVAEGENVLPSLSSETVFARIIDLAVSEGKIKLNEVVRMTKREKQVMTLLSEGMSNKEIGQKLHVSSHTVKSHIHNIMDKLALHTRLEIANYSYSEDSLQDITRSSNTINN